MFEARLISVEVDTQYSRIYLQNLIFPPKYPPLMSPASSKLGAVARTFPGLQPLMFARNSTKTRSKDI